MNDMPPVLSDSIGNVINVTEQLRQLRQRLAELDTERASVVEQINGCMETLAQTAARHVKPPQHASVAELALWTLRQNRGRAFAPADIANLLQFRSEPDFTNVRVALARLVKRGVARKVAHGRYMAVD
jgi:hypothetical protein